MSTRKGPVFSMKKRINPDIVLLVAALALIFFTIGFFLGRNSLSPADPVTIETAKQAQQDNAPKPATEVPAEPGTAELPADSDGLLDINSATAEELETLPGIGDVLARRIVDYRTEYGPFAEVNGLLEVSGIGDQKLEAIEFLITVR